MDVFDFLNTGGYKTIANPNYNPKSKKNTEPAELRILDLNGENQPGVDMALVDFSNQHILSSANTEKFADLGAHWNPYEDINKQLANQQSNIKKILNSVAQTIVSELGIGTIKGFSDLFDLIGQVSGFSDPNYTNPFTDVLEQAQEDFKNYAPIYADPSKSVLNGGLADVGWWASNIPSIASSLTLLIPSTAISKALSYTGKAAKIGSYTKKALNVMTGANKAIRQQKKLNAIQSLVNSSAASRTVSTFLENGLTATLSRAMENYQEARQTYKEVLPEAIEKINSMSDEEYEKFCAANNQLIQDYGLDKNDRTNLAKGIAKASADRTFQMDWVNVGFDVLQMYALRNLWRGKSDVSSSSLRRANIDAAKYAGKTADEIKAIKNALPFKTKALEKIEDLAYSSKLVVGAQLSEGVEEMVNYVSAQEGINLGKILLDKAKGSKNTGWGASFENIFDTRLLQYANAPELWDSAFWGVLGGIVFQGAGSAFRRVESTYKNKNSAANEEAKRSLPWYKFDELPEIKRGLSEIQARATDFNQYQTHLKKIKEGIDIYNSQPGNEVRFETEVEQELAEAKLRKEFIAKQKLRAMNSGTNALYDAYLNDDKLRQSMVEAGFFDDYNNNTKEYSRNQEKAEKESKAFVDEARRISQETEALYNEELTHLNAQSSYINTKHDKEFSDKFLTDDTIPVEYLQIIAVNNTLNRLQQSNIRQDLNEVTAEIEEQHKLIADKLDESIDYEAAVKLGVLTTQLAYLRATKRKILQDKNQNLSKSVQLYNINKQIESIEKQILDSGSRAQLAYATFQSMRYVLDTNGKIKTTTDEKQNAESYVYRDHMLAQQSADNIIQDFDAHDVYHLNKNELTPLSDELIGKYNTLVEDTDAAYEKMLNEVPQYNALLQKKATLESQMASTNSSLVRTLQDVKHEISVLHNTMNEARATAINNALQNIVDLYNQNPEEVEKAIRTYISNTNDNSNTSLSEEDYNKLTQSIDVLELSKPYNEGLLSDLNNILRRQDYIKLQEQLDELQNGTTTPQEETTQNSTTNRQPISANNNQQLDNTTQQTQKVNTSQNNPQNQTLSANDNTQPNTNQNTFFGELEFKDGGYVITNVNKQTPSANSVAITETGMDTYNLDVRNNQKHLQDSRLFDQQGIDHLDNIVVIDKPVLGFDRGKYIVLKKGTLQDTTKAPQQQVPSTGEQKSNSNADRNTSLDGTVVDPNKQYIEQTTSPVKGRQEMQGMHDYVIDQEDIYDTTSNAILGHLSNYIKQNTKNKTAEEKQQALDNYINSDEFKDYISSLKTDKTITDKATSNSVKTISNLLKRRSKQASSVTEVIIAQSSITEYSSLHKNDNILTEFNSAVDNIINHYIEYAGLSKINDKYYFNLEDFLRYLNKEVANDPNIARLIFDNVKNYLFSKHNTKYVLIDKNNVVKTEFLNNVNKSEEIRDNERFAITSNNHSVAINDYINNLSQSDKLKYNKVFDLLNVGDNLYIQVTKSSILLKTSNDANAVTIGILPVPYTDINNGRYVMFNDGWRSDIIINGENIESDFYNFVKNIFLSTDENSINLRNILYQLAYDSTNNEQYSELIDKFSKNPIIDSILNDKSHTLIKADATPEQLASGLVKLLVYSETSNSTLGTSENSSYNEAYKKRIEQSLRSWFTKLYNSYSTIDSIKNGAPVNVTISKITDGEIILKTRKTNLDELLHVKDAVANLNPEIHKVGAVMSEDYITTAGNNPQFAPGMKRGSTFIILPNRSGQNAYVKAYGVSAVDDQISDDAKDLLQAVRSNLKILINKRSEEHSEESYEDLKNFLHSIFRSDNNKASLFTGVSLKTTRKGNNEYISLSIPNTKHSIIIYKYNSGTDGYSNKYGLSDRNFYTALDENYNPTKVHETLDAIINSLTFNIDFNYILSDTNRPLSENSFVKKENNKFVIEIPSFNPEDNKPFRLEYNSYNEFLINNNLLKVNTEIIDGSNFRKRSENQKANQILEVKITPKNQQVNTNDVKANASQQQKIEQKTIQEKVVDILQKDDKDANKGLEIAQLVFGDTNVLNSLERLNLLPKNIIFDAEYNTKQGNETYHAEINTKTKQVTVGQLWLDMFNNPNTRLQAIRKLIHEQLHSFLKENKGYVKNATSIYNEFKDKLESSFDNEWAKKWRDDRHVSKDKQIEFFKQFLFESYSPEAAVEEFLIESLTNANLADLLNNIQADEYKANNRGNLLQKIMKFLSELFNWGVKEGSLYEKELKTLKAAFTDNKTTIETESKESAVETKDAASNEKVETKEEEQEQEDEDEDDNTEEDEDEDEEVSTTRQRKRSFNSIRRRSSVSEFNANTEKVFSNAPNLSAFVDNLPIQQRSNFLSLLNRGEISIMC